MHFHLYPFQVENLQKILLVLSTGELNRIIFILVLVLVHENIIGVSRRLPHSSYTDRLLPAVKQNGL